MILVDTNVLLLMAQPAHSVHESALSAVTALAARGQTMCVVPQVTYEYWVVATRPVQMNGLGMTAAEAVADISKIDERFPLLPEEREIFDVWQRLVTQRQVLGKNAHDAHLVAAMLVHRVSHLLTFNASDFVRYSEINVIDALAPATG